MQQIPGVKLFKKTWTSAGEFGTALGECMHRIAVEIGGAITNIDLSWDNILEHLYWQDDDIVFIADNDVVVLTDIFIEPGTQVDTITVNVNKSEAESAEDTLKRFYWTSDGKLVSNGYIVNQIANNTTDQEIVDEITTKASIVNDMSDITQTVKKY